MVLPGILTCRTASAGRLMRLAGIVVILLSMLTPVAGANPVDPNWSPPRTVYIPETGQSIDGLFLDLWRGGGVQAYGNPITAEITEAEGQIVQYYDYARFEYWPEGDEDGNYVTLGEVGRDLAPPFVLRRIGYQADTTPLPDARLVQAWRPVSAVEATRLAAAEPSYRYVPEADHGVWGGFRTWWEATGEAAYLGNPLSEEYVLDGVNFQTFERGQLRWREGEDIAVVPIGKLLAERFKIPMTPRPQGDLPVYDEALFVPPALIPDWGAAPPAPSGGRAVVISLGQQALWAYEDGAVIRSTYVSTGREKFRTPAGYFTVINKIPIQDMEGVIGGEYYNVPDVPDVLYFTDRGHAIHGTYWHNNFGTPMSHGCVNLPMDVADWMYDWAPMGMPVLIVE